MNRWLCGVFLLSFHLLWLVSCANRAPGISPDPSRIHYPIGITVHPSGKFLYVANSNFDLAYTGGTLMAIDTKEDPKNIETVSVNGVKTERILLPILSKATVETGSFAGELVLNRAGDRGWLALRQDQVAGTLAACSDAGSCGDGEECIRGFCRSSQTIQASSIIEFQLDTSKEEGHILCDNKDLRSAGGENKETGGVGVENGTDAQLPPRCGDKSKLFLEDNPFPYGLQLVQTCQVSCKSKSDCGEGETCRHGYCFSNKTLAPLCDSDADCSGKAKCTDGRLVASHLNSGGFSDIRLPRGGWGSLSRSEKENLRQVKGVQGLPDGTTAMAVVRAFRQLKNTAGEILLATRLSNRLFLLPPSILLNGDNSVVRELTFSHIENGNTGSGDLRGMAIGVDPATKRVRLYVASRRPSAVLVYELSRAAEGAELDIKLVTTIAVGSGPAQLVYHRGVRGDQLFVVCSLAKRIDIIDPTLLQVTQQVQVGQQPYFLTVYEPTDPKAKVQQRRAYVANFLETSISVIDLDRYRVIGLVRGVNTVVKVRP